MKVFKEISNRKAPRQCKLNGKMIVWIRYVMVDVLMELSPGLLDRSAMPVVWTMGVAAPTSIFIGDIMKCGKYGGVNYLKIVVKALEKRLTMMV